VNSATIQLAGRPVQRIGFGAMQLPGPRVFGPPADRERALTVLRRAIELGVNHIDTSQYYGPAVANELIREALHPYPDDLVLVSKVGAARDDRGRWLPAQRPEELRAGVEDNLRTLGVERVDVVNLRLLDGAEVAFEDQLAEMVALRDEGKIGGVGVSNVTLDQVEKALAHTTIACVQNPMSMLNREDEPVLERCAREGIPYVPFFPLGSAFGIHPHVTDDERVQAVAQRLGATPAQVGLAWLLRRSPNILLIPGTSSPEHLAENVAAGELVLDDEVFEQLAA
jgi:aryl-alcohol dehydrogenase-like predicted oxidoreductase